MFLFFFPPSYLSFFFFPFFRSCLHKLFLTSLGIAQSIGCGQNTALLFFRLCLSALKNPSSRCTLTADCLIQEGSVKWHCYTSTLTLSTCLLEYRRLHHSNHFRGMKEVTKMVENNKYGSTRSRQVRNNLSHTIILRD